ncbi:hypothetical protein QJR52_02770 [Clostridium baratii]|uniref:hypothetical protein n=1 Tax=Clostridium baratii TaxID=1561 RepID=UPI0030D46B5A
MNLKEMLNPFPVQRTKVYGVISEIEKFDKDLFILNFDLVNEEMIRFDNKIYSGNMVKYDNPKGKLYLYFMTIETDHDTLNRYFLNQKDDEVYEYELIPIDMYDNNIDSNAIICNIYFTASPISEKSYYIKLIKKVFPIPIASPDLKNEPLDNLADIKNELNSVFKYPMKVDYFRVHNVGQGGCNTVAFKSNNKLFFDIGITKYKNKDILYNRYKSTFSLFKLDDYDTVILSHWDEDHFIGLCLDSEGILLRKHWIVPDFGISPNVRRIAYIIDNYGKLIRISNKIKGKFYDKDELILFKGSGENKNDSGIILGINGSRQNLIAMGDASYKSARCIEKYSIFGKKVFKEIDYLVVPHHGAEVEGDIIFNPKVPISESGYYVHPSDAVISVGYNPKTYKHPRTNTIVKLYNKQFRIIRTDKDGRQFIKF